MLGMCSTSDVVNTDVTLFCVTCSGNVLFLFFENIRWLLEGCSEDMQAVVVQNNKHPPL